MKGLKEKETHCDKLSTVISNENKENIFPNTCLNQTYLNNTELNNTKENINEQTNLSNLLIKYKCLFYNFIRR